MQSDRNRLKTDTSHAPTTFARHEYGRVGDFKNCDVIISSEVVAYQKVSIFKLFPSDWITLYQKVYK